MQRASPNRHGHVWEERKNGSAQGDESARGIELNEVRSAFSICVVCLTRLACSSRHVSVVLGWSLHRQASSLHHASYSHLSPQHPANDPIIVISKSPATSINRFDLVRRELEDASDLTLDSLFCDI